MHGSEPNKPDLNLYTKIHLFPKQLEHLINHVVHSKELVESYTMDWITIFKEKYWGESKFTNKAVKQAVKQTGL